LIRDAGNIGTESFCVDAHSVLLAGANAKSTADAIRASRPDLISDPKTRKVAE